MPVGLCRALCSTVGPDPEVARTPERRPGGPLGPLAAGGLGWSPALELDSLGLESVLTGILQSFLPCSG